jgi:hypothetical protein
MTGKRDKTLTAGVRQMVIRNETDQGDKCQVAGNERGKEYAGKAQNRC